jgi:hypothetical protein
MEPNNCFLFVDRKTGKTTYIPYRSVTHVEICKTSLPNKEIVAIFYAVTQSYSELKDENISYMLKSYSEWLKNF